MKKNFWLLFICVFLSVSMLLCACSYTGVEENGGNETEVELKHEIDRSNKIEDIVADGEGAYKIVIPAAALPSVKYAATEMQSYIKKVSGAELPIVLDAAVEADLQGKYISVGKTSLLDKSGYTVNYEGLNGDGYIVQTVGNTLLINGASEKGTIYGVYEFIEQIMGVRFISAEYTYIPQSENVPLYAIDIVDAPAFELRNEYSYSIRDSAVFYTQMRLNAPEVNVTSRFGGNAGWYNKFNTIHNAFYWVSDEYLDEHPEFYAVNEMGTVYRQSTPVLGSQYKGTKGYAMQLNLTSGITEDGKLDETMEVSVAKIALESLKTFIQDDPTADVFFFGHNDSQVRCRCEKCRDAELKYGGASGILVRFMNVLSDEIGKWMQQENIDREITLATWAYLETEEAPVKEVSEGVYEAVDESVVPRDNVAIRTAPIFLDWYYSMQDEMQLKKNGESAKILEKWSALTDNLMIWTYEDSFGAYLWYTPTMRTWSENLNYFKEKGLSYVMLQDNYSGYGSWQTDMRTYVGSKMLWNPSYDIDALKEEFMLHYFGADAAPLVKQMMDKFDERNTYLADTLGEAFTIYTPTAAAVSWDITEWYSAEFMEECMELVQNAVNKVNANTEISADMRNMYLKNLASVAATPEYMVLSNYEAYYGNIGKTDFARKFFEHCEHAGILRIAENYLLNDYKSGFGL